MSEQYRDAVSKKDFKKERRSQNRMAGEVFEDKDTNQYGDPFGTMYLGGSPTYNEATGKDETYRGADGTITRGKDTFPDGAPMMDPKTDDIYKYDTDGYGAGYKKGTNRLSKIDLKNLKNQGYSLEDIVDYADNIGETGVITDGGAAQRLLDRYRDKIANKLSKEKDDDGLTISDPPFNPTPIDPIDDGGDPPFTGVPEIIGAPGVDVGDFIPSPGTNINQGNSLLQSIIQKNDINSQVYGDGNVTTINQDNSASNYGGNQYNFARIPGYYS